MATMTAPRPHPLYVKAAAGDYITVADTAALARLALARAFPGVKFSVRSNVYAGGGSVNIKYDGLDHYAPLSHCYCPDGPDVDRDYGANRCNRCGYVGRLDPVYRDGMPSKAAVTDAVAVFAGRGFDGMIDLAYSIHAWLNPDGSAVFGRTAGTTGSLGVDPADSAPRPLPGSVLVTFGASYVFVDDDGRRVG